jgi:hypothetical protein
MFPNPKQKSLLQMEIDKLYRLLTTFTATDNEYAKVVQRIGDLEKIKAEQKPYRPNPDTLLLASVNLIAVAMIIRHENLNVITSKALSFVRMR